MVPSYQALISSQLAVTTKSLADPAVAPMDSFSNR
jgi:hypothetical protein